jgi:uncharacterized protein YqgC (DUF456 family)
MSVEFIVGLVLAWLIMAVGMVGSVVPGLPGPPLVLAAAVGHRLYFGPQSAGNIVLATLVLLTLLAVLLDYLASIVGARKFGATWRGVVGAALGAILGLLAGPLGLLAGPFLGAAALEMVGGRQWREAGRAGLGAFLGLLLGGVGKLACCAAMIGLFTLSVAWNR